MTPGTVTHQTSLSMGFSRQEYWSGSPFPPAGDLSDPGIEPPSLTSGRGFFTTRTTGKPIRSILSSIEYIQVSCLILSFTLEPLGKSIGLACPFIHRACRSVGEHGWVYECGQWTMSQGTSFWRSFVSCLSCHRIREGEKTGRREGRKKTVHCLIMKITALKIWPKMHRWKFKTYFLKYSIHHIHWIGIAIS